MQLGGPYSFRIVATAWTCLLLLIPPSAAGRQWTPIVPQPAETVTLTFEPADTLTVV